MNLPLALAPALLFGVNAPLIARMGDRPIRQLVKTSVGVGVFASLISIAFRPHISPAVCIFSFASGLFWAAATGLQYVTFGLMGTEKSFTIQTGVQLVANAIIGAVVFGEWKGLPSFAKGALAIALIVVGVALAGGGEGKSLAGRDDVRRGVLLSVIAGLAFAAYGFTPKLAGVQGLEGVLPQACGIGVGSLVIVVVRRARRSKDAPGGHDAAGNRAAGLYELTGVIPGLIWGLGNLALIYSNAINGQVIGFTCAQLALVVTAALSVTVLHEVSERRTVARILTGVAIVVAGTVLLSGVNG